MYELNSRPKHMFEVMQGIKYNEAEHKNQSEKHEEKNVGIKYHKVPRREFKKWGDTDQRQMLQSQRKW